MPAIVLQARVRRILGHGTSGDKRARAREERGAQGPVRTLESRHHDLLLIVTSSPCIPTSMKTSACRGRSEEHTSELQSLMSISYAVFCLKKQTNKTTDK